VSAAAPPEAQAAAGERVSIFGAARGYFEKVKAGDAGSLPVIFGMVIITIIFTAKVNVFFTAVNFNNLIVQMAPIALIAIGVVFVLLLGEIDLSIGYVSGLCGVCVAWFQDPGTGHHVTGLVAIALAIGLGALIGLLQGSFVALIGVPSFVVTLAGLLAWQGVIIKWIGSQASIGIQDKYVNDTANYFLTPTTSWIVAAIINPGLRSHDRCGPRRPSPWPGSRSGTPRSRRSASASSPPSPSPSRPSRTTTGGCRSPG